MERELGPWVLGADLGGTWIRVGLAAPGGEIRHRERARTSPEGPGPVMDQLAQLVRQLISREPSVELSSLTLGIGVPGPVDAGRGVVFGAPNLPNWREDVELAAGMEQRLGFPCLVQHDASLAALAEHRRGAGLGTQDFIYVTVSTGIGAGLVIGGKLYQGAHGTAGEFGHWVIVPDGPPCGCGNRGCLEALSSGPAIARQAGAESAEEVGLAAAAGDHLANEVLQRAGGHLGVALGGLINLMDPELVALGGGVMLAGPVLWEAVLRGVARGSFPEVRQRCRIEPARLGQDQGLIGAVEWATEGAEEGGAAGP